MPATKQNIGCAVSLDNILKLLTKEDPEARESLYANAGLPNSMERLPKAVLQTTSPHAVYLAAAAQFMRLHSNNNHWKAA